MLQYKEFVPFAPSHGFIRKDHGFGCEGSSVAMKIWCNDDGTISAKCWRCGQKGY